MTQSLPEPVATITSDPTTGVYTVTLRFHVAFDWLVEQAAAKAVEQVMEGMARAMQTDRRAWRFGHEPEPLANPDGAPATVLVRGVPGGSVPWGQQGTVQPRYVDLPDEGGE